MENLEIIQHGGFEFRSTQLAGLWIVQRKPILDQRGFFCRFFCGEAFQVVGLHRPLAQINHTRTVKKGAVRGLHFQYPPYAETKLVSCLRGAVYDVAVDIRRGSPTFMRWHGEILSSDNMKSLLIPEGFAHGFQALVEDCELMYLHSAPFHEPSEGALNAVDPQIGIVWPVAISHRSNRDLMHPLIAAGFKGVEI